MTTAAQKRRTASDALKGTATPAEETLPEVPATEDTKSEEKPAEEATTDAAKAEDTKPEETPADAVADAAKAAEVDGAVPASVIAEDEDEDDTVAVTVVIAQFNYFDEDGSHCSAAKGVTVHVDRAAAERGVKLGAVKVQD